MELPNIISIIFLSSFLGLSSSINPRKYCFADGECHNSLFVDQSVSDSREDCRQMCQDNEECQYFTFTDNEEELEEDDQCLLLANCLVFSNTTCDNCVTGERDCELYQCFVQGQCRGTYLDARHSETVNECLEFCRIEDGCEWFSFDESDYQCSIFSTCEDLDDQFEACQSGEVECENRAEFTKVLIASGHGPSLSTESESEIVDLASFDTQCRQPASYPLPGLGCAVALSYNNQPMICGGNPPYTDACYVYDPTTDVWDRSVSLLQPTSDAVAVKVAYNEYWIMGGTNSSRRPMSSSEVFKEGRFQQGNDLPEPMYGHCAVRLNSSHIFIASANSWNVTSNSSFISPHTFLFNLQTLQWNTLPSINAPRSWRACGFVKTSNGDQEIVVAGGSASGIGYVDTVEILSLSDMVWRSGPNLPHPLDSPFVVQFENHFLLTGGWNGRDRLSTIYQFDDSYQWIELGVTLEYARNCHVAFSVPDEWTSCSKKT